eukprot:6257671-Pyramimonas_sp.AAC.1
MSSTRTLYDTVEKSSATNRLNINCLSRARGFGPPEPEDSPICVRASKTGAPAPSDRLRARGCYDPTASGPAGGRTPPSSPTPAEGGRHPEGPAGVT